MVADSGATVGFRRIRSLNQPKPLQVEVDGEGQPAAVYLSKRRRRTETVLETWRIDDEWWRDQPVSRLYFRMMLEDGRMLTIYRDLLSGQWARQQY